MWRMSDEWFDRLIEAVKADPRSDRAISRDAKLGTNFVQQLLRERKKPRVDSLMALLEALGSASLLYIFKGVKVGPQDEELLALVLRLDPSLREPALRLLQQVQARESSAQHQGDRQA
jgi:hypothetical protein